MNNPALVPGQKYQAGVFVDPLSSIVVFADTKEQKMCRWLAEVEQQGYHLVSVFPSLTVEGIPSLIALVKASDSVSS